MRSSKVSDRYVIVLERGEEFMRTLTSFCREKDIFAATFQGIGALERVTLGYYNLTTRQYVFKEENAVFEVASMHGNISLVDGVPFVHAHAVLSRTDESLSCIGGHIQEARVAVTLEIFLTPFSAPLTRTLDDSIGLKLLSL